MRKSLTRLGMLSVLCPADIRMCGFRGAELVVKAECFYHIVNMLKAHALCAFSCSYLCTGTLDYMAPEVLRFPLKCQPGDIDTLWK
jgi:hypothetical protein